MAQLYRLFTDADWLFQHRGKFAGLAFGTLGIWTIALFLTVAITGVPFSDTPRQIEQVYFIQ